MTLADSYSKQAQIRTISMLTAILYLDLELILTDLSRSVMIVQATRLTT